MKNYLSAALGMTLANALFTLTLFFLGYQSDPEKINSSAIKSLGLVFGIAIMVVGLIFAMRATREAASDKALSYGRGVGVGALTGVFFGLFSAIFQFIYLSMINPEIHDLMVESARVQMEANGQGAQFEQAEGIIRVWTSPAVMSVFSFFAGVAFTTVVALFVAIGMKRAPQAPAAEASPPMPA